MKINRWIKTKLPAAFTDKKRQFAPLSRRAFWFGSGKKQKALSLNHALLVLLFLFSGLGTGEYVWHKWHYCAEINADRSPFYGRFAQQLKAELGKRGYSFSCPAFMPKTAIRFVYTHKDRYSYPMPEKKKNVKNIGIVGDCYLAANLEYLYNFDYILTITSFHNGSFAGLGYRSAYFQLSGHKDGDKLLCNTYETLSEDSIRQAGIWLDDIIQRAFHD